MERSFLEQLRIGEQPLPAEVIDAIWNAHEQDTQAHAQALAQVRFESVLDAAVSRAGGRNVKAISALLDLQALQASDDPKVAVEQALSRLKKDSGYLFAEPSVPPYASGTGAAQPMLQEQPQTLAGALRQRMTDKN